ncbi:MAG: glycosyltransferase [Acidiferrobacterales bacterium]
MPWVYLILPAALVWLGILVLPYAPWRVREVLDAEAEPAAPDLSDVTALIPARNEAETIGQTLNALAAQGQGLTMVVVDDQSGDRTVEIARNTTAHGLRVVPGRPLPAGWSGKLWALEQGRPYLSSRLTLLMDADIELQPGALAALRAKLERDRLHFLSLMASLRMQTFWERLLMPAFIYFFKLVYPFRLANDPGCRKIAAAAGGCILLETRLIDEIGGFQALRGALIDDCELARRVKALGYRTWVGLTHSVRSLRCYDELAAIWNMVARSAFTQLRYSTLLLLACTGIFMIAFWLPIVGCVFPNTLARWIAVMTLVAMMLSYLPTLRFYGLSGGWAVALPLIGTLYLAMTWTSAVRYWRGKRSRWKGRVYSRTLDSSKH